MAISATEYLKLVSEGKEPFTFPAKPKCVIADCTQVATHPSPNGKVCEDCYFDLLGEEVESHPIGR